MHIWADLITREAAFLATLLALGAGPAAFLSARWGGAVRLALAPALGLCLGVVVTNTLVQYEPVRSTYWVLIVLAVLSLATAVWRIARAKTRLALPLRELAQIAVIDRAVLGPASYTLHQRATVGPVALGVYDAAGYVAEIDSQQTRSISTASERFPPYQNLEQGLWSRYARRYQNMDAAPLEGSLNDVLSLNATDTQSPFMIVLVFAGALGAFAAFRYATGSRSWCAVLAGALYGGPFFMQLWADSSQAAICGLGLLLPFVVIGAEALRTRRIADLVLLALVSSGLLTVYPLFVPQAALGSAIVLAFLIVASVRRQRPSWPQTFGVLWRLALVVGLAAAFTPIAFGRDLRYWQAILNGTLSFAGLPIYKLPVGVLPGWILQTREFYYLPALGRGGIKQLLFGGLLPLGMIVVIGVGLRWQRRTTVLLAFAAICAVLAEYGAASSGCEYCAQRNLLPLGPMAAVLLAVGVGGLFALRTNLGRVAGVIAAVIIIGAVTERMRVERIRILDTAYFLDSSVRSVLQHLPAGRASVDVEGFGANLRGPGEMPLVYELVNERAEGHASISIESRDYSSFSYLGDPKRPGPEFDPHYRYVLTRFAGVGTERRLIARSDGIALQQRVRSLDVTPIANLGSPLARLDPGGFAWIQGGALDDALLVYVTGGAGRSPVWVHLEIAFDEAVALPPQPGVSSRQDDGRLSVCIRASGSAPLRRASLGLSFTPIPGQQPNELFQLPQPAEGLELVGMSASTRRCVP